MSGMKLKNTTEFCNPSTRAMKRAFILYITLVGTKWNGCQSIFKPQNKAISIYRCSLGKNNRYWLYFCALNLFRNVNAFGDMLAIYRMSQFRIIWAYKLTGDYIWLNCKGFISKPWSGSQYELSHSNLILKIRIQSSNKYKVIKPTVLLQIIIHLFLVNWIQNEWFSRLIGKCQSQLRANWCASWT